MVYDSQFILEVVRGAKAFLSLRVGVTRGEVPTYQDQTQTIERLKRQLGQHKERLSQKDELIAQLQSELSKEHAGQLDSTTFDGVSLPPKTLRPCGPKLQDDETYLTRAREEADKLVKYLGLTPESCLLDVGSGPGRLAIGILQSIGDIRKYRGVDVDKNSVHWGQQHITSEHPNFRFLHIDVKNRRYNPEGSKADGSFAFPFADGEFDIVILYSVFTHMLADGVRAYLKEFQRLLGPDGKILLTAFVEDGVPDVEENPEGYRNRQWKGALHCVRYNTEHFETLLDENGFRSDGYYLVGRERKVSDGHTEFGQRGFFISRKASSPIVLT